MAFQDVSTSLLQAKAETLRRVRTEMSIHVLAYNMKRVIAIIGVGPLPEAIRA